MEAQREEGERVLNGPGGRMPALGLGTWDLRGATCRRSVEHALEIGYRHVDTAEMYNNETEVGRGLDEAGVDRECVFLVTKVWHTNLDEQGVRRALAQSLERLGTDYVDLLLIHWPSQSVPLSETLSALADLREAGKTRHIGVSNFNVEQLEEAVRVSPAPIFCNQVEYHPYLSQQPLLEFCDDNDVLLTAYCPLARGRVFDEPVLSEIGERHGKSAGQVTLRWLIQQPNVGAIPRSSSKDHIAENFDIFDFELTDDEMADIFGLARGGRIVSAMGGASFR